MQLLLRKLHIKLKKKMRQKLEDFKKKLTNKKLQMNKLDTKSSWLRRLRLLQRVKTKLKLQDKEEKELKSE
jgi:hypothetical protein